MYSDHCNLMKIIWWSLYNKYNLTILLQQIRYDKWNRKKFDLANVMWQIWSDLHNMTNIIYPIRHYKHMIWQLQSRISIQSDTAMTKIYMHIQTNVIWKVLRSVTINPNWLDWYRINLTKQARQGCKRQPAYELSL